MRIPLFWAVVCLLSCSVCIAQKPSKEKPPTKAGYEQALKQAQGMLDSLDPETRRMMDSMGIKMPNMKKMALPANVTDKQLADAWEDENRIVPNRDAARIAAIAPTVSSAAITGYISSLQTKLFSKLKPASKTLGEKLYTGFKSSGYHSAKIGNAAAGLWMMGKVQPAFYLMSKVCVDDPSNTDNISNYAAMLSMLGAPQSAIPLLNNLNARFPKNNTILNNLGQAWFGLGELTKAGTYLDSAIRFYPGHPQATMTKALIEESKGNNTAAVTLVKQSLRTAYTEDKEDKLRSLGGEASASDYHLPSSPKPDALNLGGFQPPAYPKSVMECVLIGKEWAEFDRQLQEEMDRLKKQQDDAKAIVVRRNTFKFAPLYAAAANKLMSAEQDDYFRKQKAILQKIADFANGPGKQLSDNYEKTMKKLKKEDLDQTGEGKPNKDYCPHYQKASDEFLRANNGPMENFYHEMLSLDKVHYNYLAYYMLYANWTEEYNTVAPAIKASWLLSLKSHSFRSITTYMCGAKDKDGQAQKLAKFDDVNCQYHSSFWTPVGTMKMDCNSWTTELDLQVVKFGLRQDMEKETFADQFVSCTVEVSAKAGKEVKAGPLAIGAEASAGVGVEIGRNGVSDVFVTAGASAGASIGDPVGVSAGADGRISIISGTGSISGSGLFGK